MTIKPGTIQELCEVLQAGREGWDQPAFLPRGGGTKPALSTPSSETVESLDLTALSGVLEYEPGEFTFTALAGTRLADIQALLAQNGQYLPFDPLLVERGATLGGTVAANAAGPGRYHYGGVRDFLLGVRFVNSQGILVRGGGKVVKNAAGFDLPKLMVGSLGELGALAELSFKVFPRPEAFVTLRLACAGLDEALQAMQQAAAARLDLDALELVPLESGYDLWARLAGLEQALPARLERLCAILSGCEVLSGADEGSFWQQARELAWVSAGEAVEKETVLVKVPLTAGRIPALETALAGKVRSRRYSAGGQVAWLALDKPPASLQAPLVALSLSGVVYFGPPGTVRLGQGVGGSFYQRVKSALDPVHHWRSAAPLAEA